MHSPSGWMEPGQRPEFDEFTLVLKGTLCVEYEGGKLEVNAGLAVIAHKGEWVKYSTPGAEGAEYIAICLPAFSPDTLTSPRDKSTGILKGYCAAGLKPHCFVSF